MRFIHDCLVSCLITVPFFVLLYTPYGVIAFLLDGKIDFALALSLIAAILGLCFGVGQVIVEYLSDPKVFREQETYQAEQPVSHALANFYLGPLGVHFPTRQPSIRPGRLKRALIAAAAGACAGAVIAVATAEVVSQSRDALPLWQSVLAMMTIFGVVGAVFGAFSASA